MSSWTAASSSLVFLGVANNTDTKVDTTLKGTSLFLMLAIRRIKERKVTKGLTFKNHSDKAEIKLHIGERKLQGCILISS